MNKTKKLSPGTKLKVGSHDCVILNYLSKGGFAHIYKVQINPPENNSDIACLKRVLVKDREGLSLLRSEVKVMTQLIGCPNIVQYYDSHASKITYTNTNNDTNPNSEDFKFEVLVLMELCPNKSLLDYMNSKLKTKLTESEIIRIMYDITLAVSQLHYLPNPLIHKDIKIENVLIDSQGNFKLCDFGSTSYVINAIKTKEDYERVYEIILHQTTPQYRCPEMIDLNKRLPIDEKSDIWALGVFLYKLCYYITPFETQGQLAILNSSFSFPPSPKYSEDLKNLIIVLLQINPNIRPNIYQVMEIVCQLANKKIPIIDKYHAEPYKYYQLLKTKQEQLRIQQQQQQQQQAIMMSQYAMAQQQQQQNNNQKFPSAGSLPSSFPVAPPAPPPQAAYYQQGYPLVKDSGDTNSKYLPYPKGHNKEKDPNGMKQLTETLLQTTNEMIEDNNILVANKRSSSSSSSQHPQPDLLDDAEIRYPSVDQLNHSFFDMNDQNNYNVEHNPPQQQRSISNLYPTNVVSEKSSNSIDYLSNNNNNSNTENHLATENYLSSNKSNVSGGPSLFNSSTMSVNQVNNSDFYSFEKNSTSPSRQPSMKSKISGNSRPSSYIDPNYVLQDSTKDEVFMDNKNNYSYGNLTNNDDVNAQYNSTINNTLEDYTNNGAKNTTNISFAYENNLLDFDDSNDDIFKDLNTTNDLDSSIINRPKTPSNNNPFPIATTVNNNNNKTNDKNPWSNKKKKEPESIQNTKNISDLFVQTKSIVNGAIDKDEIISPITTKFSKKNPPNEDYINVKKIRSKIDDSKIEGINNHLQTLKLENKYNRLPYPDSLNGSNDDLLGLDLPSEESSRKPSGLILETKLSAKNVAKLSNLENPSKLKLPNNNNNNIYSSVRSVNKIRELVHAQEEVEVDLSSNSSIDNDEIEVEEEDAGRYLTKINSTKIKKDEFGNNDNIPTLPRIKTMKSANSSPVDNKLPSPVDLLFEKKENAKKKRFSGTFSTQKFKRSNSNDSSTNSPNTSKLNKTPDFFSPIDPITKKNLGSIFSDSDNDSILDDIKEPGTKLNERERDNSMSSETEISSAKKLSRREKVRSFLGGSGHHHHSTSNY